MKWTGKLRLLSSVLLPARLYTVVALCKQLRPRVKWQFDWTPWQATRPCVTHATCVKQLQPGVKWQFDWPPWQATRPCVSQATRPCAKCAKVPKICYLLVTRAVDNDVVPLFTLVHIFTHYLSCGIQNIPTFYQK